MDACDKGVLYFMYSEPCVLSVCNMSSVIPKT